MRDQAETVAIDMKVMNETDKAYCLSATGARRDSVWLPKSQVTIEDEFAVRSSHVVHVPVWLAEKNGLV
ncbi:hypothetical protein [Paracoccus sp. 22332]|uniref:hypothetical protein n=1 Tax=Paracoccus sp. 22332 TaxID=3453913 RepID=UPI003F8774D7